MPFDRWKGIVEFTSENDSPVMFSLRMYLKIKIQYMQYKRAIA